MALSVREVFATFQGEGSRAGQPAVFVRLAGCNLWSGREQDRGTGAGGCSSWCDTQFAGGFKIEPDALLDLIDKVADSGSIASPLIVLTGGEPGLQLVRPEGLALARLLAGRQVAIETNGTIDLSPVVEQVPDLHITVSPKPVRARGSNLLGSGLDHVRQRTGTDLKVVLPCPFLDADLQALGNGFAYRFVQPVDRGDLGRGAMAEARAAAARLGWRVSVQVHKFVGVP